MASEELLCFNGINGATGDYLLSGMTAEDVAGIVLGERLDPQLKRELDIWAERATTATFGVAAGIDTADLAEAGWGVIFPYGSDPAIRSALAPLLDLRREQATRKSESRYKEFSASTGYRLGDTHRTFLARSLVEASQPADPDRGVPYYLLIVGSPEQIPFSFQYQLDVQYAVGRIWFESLEEYAQYARSVVAAETRAVRVRRRAVFFGVRNAHDQATSLSASELVEPLAQRLPQMLADERLPSWDVARIIGDEARKGRLRSLLGGADTPALLFTASHGMGFPNGDPRQLRHQGALLCQDWPGPRNWNREIPPEFYFAADDVPPEANLQGLIAFHFACYGAGTPRRDDFSHLSGRTPNEIAPYPFVAHLPRRLLGHPCGGALAVVGHVERAWGYSFHGNRVGPQTQTFEAALYQVMAGLPLGSAIEYFNGRYAALASELTTEIEEIRFGKQPDNGYLAGTWTAHNDARSYVILGDPAVRLPLVEENESDARPRAEPVVLASRPEAPPASVVLTGSAKSGRDLGSTLRDQIAGTEERFERQKAQESSFDVPASAPRLQKLNDPHRLRWRLAQLGVPDEVIDRTCRFGAAFAPITPADDAGKAVVDDRWQERILGRNDMVDAPSFLERGVAAASAVGRIRVQSASHRLVGWGTGSLISPRLLLTNNHVLSDASVAAASVVEFNVQDDTDGQPLQPAAFPFRPQDFFVTDRALDFTLVAVSDTSDDGIPLTRFGYNSGSVGDDPILVSECVNIIQHPSGRPKQIALRENEVTDVFADFLHYQTDTEPGSSGSPVFNDQWQLVALHHSGVPQRDSNGNILARDGSLWREEMGDHQIKWIANEGVRLSRILEFIRTWSFDSETARSLRDELLTANASERLTAMSDTSRTTEGQQRTAVCAAGEVALTVPLHIRVSLGTCQPLAPPPAAKAVATPVPVSSTGLTEAVSIDPDYDGREGYDPEFLGPGSLRVPLPQLAPAQTQLAARLLQAGAGSDRHELKYHHYSVVMNGERRLAFFTAVNIDGRKAREIARESDKWFYDPRIRRDQQVGNELYADNPFDRGHLVRRLDPAWGRTERIAKVANDDTFHFTNCSPQHEQFNQGQNLWQGVENFLLDRATGADQKLTVFTGPVFRDDDPVYRDVPIPLEYWKVAVLAGPDGELAALAFLVTQADLVRPVVEEAAIDTARIFQTSIAEVERLTELDFGDLRTHEVESVDTFAAGEVAGDRRMPLASFEEIRLPGGALAALPDVSFGAPGPVLTEERSPRELVQGTDLSYYLVAFDAERGERTDHPAGKISDHVTTALAAEPITDVFLFSHGWRSDLSAAREQYQGWLTTMSACEADRRRVRRLRPGFRPLLIGVHWPSEPWGDESFGIGTSFQPGAARPAVEQLVNIYAARLGNEPAVREPLQVILDAAQTATDAGRVPDEVLAAYRALDAAVALPKSGVGGPPGADWEVFEPEEICESARGDVQLQGATGFETSPGDVLLAPLRVLSFWKMKDRARVIGENMVHPLLRSLQRVAVGRDVRFHLAGHSFGCIVAAAAVAGPPGQRLLDRPVDSLVLLQGALSLWSYCSRIPEAPEQRGYFHRIVSQGLVRGPIVTTQSRFDTAVGIWYPRAAAVAGQVVFKAPGQWPKYGAVGSFGLRGPGLRTSDIRMLPSTSDYRFLPGRIYNVESSQYIRDGGGLSGAHSDIRKLEVGHCVWNAIAM